MDPTKQVFHFDVKTFANYGDTILFELIRHLFNTYNNRQGMHVTGSRNLRLDIGPAMVDGLNNSFDIAIVGGGGLFLKDTNPNQSSGWQWHCSIPMLKRMEIPLALFAVGNNRFIGQPDFSDLFREHVNLTVDKAFFVGLRNRGSIESMRDYLKPELHEKLVYQPCITTISSYLLPDVYKPKLPREKRIGFQITIGKRQNMGGFDKPAIFADLEKTIRELQGKGWEVEIIAHVPGDEEIHEHLTSRGITTKLVKLHGMNRGLYHGLEYYSNLPLTVGMRGHGQMVPFGIGNGIISIMVHNKLRYFLRDINHEQYCIDPRSEDLYSRLITLIDDWYEDFDNKRAAFAHERERLFNITMDNMATIWEKMFGSPGSKTIIPYTPFERELSITAYVASMHKDSQGERARQLQLEVNALKKDRPKIPAKGYGVHTA